MNKQATNRFVIIKKNKNGLNNSNDERIFISSESTALSTLDDMIGKTLHDVGLDEYLLKEKAFNREKFFNALSNYEKIFQSGKISTKENIRLAFQYAVFYLKNDVEMLDENNDALKSIYDYYLSVRDNINLDDFQFIGHFMSYLEENEFSSQMLLSKEVK